jgi:serine/threonine-protein kinase PpkA
LLSPTADNQDPATVVTDNVQIPGYKLLRTLGEGGMATVYLAVQESLDREVALKVMSPVLAANETFCEQFMKEGRITAKLTHPHLMTVHDIGSYNGVYYLASEFLPAGTLRERMDGLSTAEALEIARDIASGLAYAHEKGFVHRDVKPGNIMFRSNGTAVLADFGIAKAMKSVSAATMAGNAIGTPDYMSPEQAQAIPVDGRSDLYSLGAVLFETLSGSKPYEAPDAYAIALMHVTEPVPRLGEKQVWLQPLIDGLMAKNPDQRFANGEAFITACDRLVQANPQAAASAREQRSARRRAVGAGGGSTAASAAISQPAKTTGSARGLRLALLGAGVVVLIAATALGWRWTHPQPEANASVAATVAPAVQPPPLPPPPAADDSAIAALAKLDLPTLLSRGEEYTAYGQGENHYGDKLDFPAGDNAIDLFHEALKREPGNVRATKGLAQIAAFYQQGARTAFDHGLYTGTEELLEKGLRADPKNAQLLKLKADLAKAEQGG